MTSTNFTLQVYALNPDTAEAFWAAVRRVTGTDAGDPGTPGVTVALDAADTGTVEQLAPLLRAADPTAIWMMSEDPAGDYLGTCAAGHPGFLPFIAPCDGEGRVVLSYAELSACGELTPQTVRAAFGADIAEAVNGVANGEPAPEPGRAVNPLAGRTPRPLDRLVTMLKDRGWRLSSSCGNVDIWRHRLSPGEELRVLRYASQRDGDDYDAAYDAALARLAPLPAQGPVAGGRLDTDPAE